MKKLEKAAVVSIFANAFISALKFFTGIIFGSMALLADSIHSFTDIIGSVAVLLGIKFSSVKSKQFPYGLYKLENLVSLFIAIAIFYAGFEIAMESVNRLAEPIQISSPLPIGIAVFSTVFIFTLAKYKERVGKKENSPSMQSDAKHSLVDVLSSIGVLAGVTLNFLGLTVFDPVFGLIISGLVFIAGGRIFIDSVKVLLDASLDYKTMKKIEKIAEKQKNTRVKELIARNSGRYIFVDLKLKTNLSDLKKVDKIREQCEKRIREKIPRIDRVMIDIEYREKKELVYAVPLKENKKESELAGGFGLAEYFGLLKVNREKNKVLSTKIIENPHAKADRKRGILAAELLAEKNVDVLLTKKELHKGGAFYALEDNFIEIKKIKENTFKEVVKKAGEKNGF